MNYQPGNLSQYPWSRENPQRLLFNVIYKGERWDSNPRVEEPQSSALTPWLRSPFHFQH